MKRYFTGVPCKHGHVEERYVLTDNCVICQREAATAYYWRNAETCRAKTNARNKRFQEQHSARRKAAYDADPERHRGYAKRSARKKIEAYTGFRETGPKLCTKCQETKPDDQFAADKLSRDGRRPHCKACVSAAYKVWFDAEGGRKRLERNKANRRALKASNPKLKWAHMVRNATTARSRKRGESSEIFVDWLLENAPTHCPLLGIELRYDHDKTRDDSPALDRIDNTIGYRPDNCWVVSHRANRIKNDATVEELETLTKNLRAFLFRKTVDGRPNDRSDPIGEREQRAAPRAPRINPYSV